MLLVRRGIEEGGLGVVPERGQHFGHEPAHIVEPGRIEGGFIQAQEPIRNRRLVLQVAGQRSPAILVAAPHPIVLTHSRQQEAGVALRNRDQVGPAQHPPRIGK